MATIKPLEGRTVHQIQSGQVIIDLCSVAKELVENSLDAGSTSIEVRFKNHGLDSIEVQDNGAGISSGDYATIALKHYTSKLVSYDDLSSLQTFGFRGEALSSLCALSNFHIITAQEDEAPKGTRLDFEASGKLTSTSVLASQKGTTVSVENLFVNLPVRRRELEKNIKREYGKVLGVLQAYACISTQARISISNVMAKGKKTVVFATRSNPSTRVNIANIFGAKTLAGLVPMDLSLELEPTGTASRIDLDANNKQVKVIGHISRPIFGEGRQAPDRQMFFVNSRPCGLPQVAKVFNEVYKSYNLSQSPFIFANIILDTNAYDVNVSPDKRTILLHEQAKLLESLKASLTDLFEQQDQTVPHSQHPIIRLPSFKESTLSRGAFTVSEAQADKTQNSNSEDRLDGSEAQSSSNDCTVACPSAAAQSLIGNFASRGTTERSKVDDPQIETRYTDNGLSKDKQQLIRKLGKGDSLLVALGGFDDTSDRVESYTMGGIIPRPVQDFNERTAEQKAGAVRGIIETGVNDIDDDEGTRTPNNKPLLPPTTSIVHNAFDRMRPRRKSPEMATITIGSKTTTSVLGSSIYTQPKASATPTTPPRNHTSLNNTAKQKFSSSMQAFAASGSDLIKTVGVAQSRSRPSNPQLDGLSDEEASNDFSIPDASVVSEDGEQDCEEELQLKSHSLEHKNREAFGEASDESDSDVGYGDEDEKKALEEAKVAEMIRQAEDAAALPSQNNKIQIQQTLKSAGTRDSTTDIVQKIDISIEKINRQLYSIRTALQRLNDYKDSDHTHQTPIPDLDTANTTDPQTLTITKPDFQKMHIIGQFNLGFILATRNITDLFIIDQHASDEKVNFERLQATTIIQNQRLVHPRPLELTAVDEEIVLENRDALLRNGFIVDIDTSGNLPVGQRCSLVSLPMSKETTFKPSDLEELIALLADAPNPSSTVPRPTKIRKMLAMRACRSSIMIGKVLTQSQMRRMVAKMGEIDRPWNCPHGRPTMRHVCGLDGFGGLLGRREEEKEREVDWKGWIEKMRGRGEEGEDEEEKDEGRGRDERDEDDENTAMENVEETGSSDEEQDAEGEEM